MTDIQDPRHAVVQRIINDNWRKGSASDLATKVLAGLDDYVQPGWLAEHDTLVMAKALNDYARLVRFTVTRVDSTKQWADISCTEVPTGRTWTKRQHLNKGRFAPGTYL